MTFVPRKNRKGGLFNAVRDNSRNLDEVITFIEVMKVAGGYWETISMPKSAYNTIVKGLEEIAKRQKKNSNKNK